MNIKPCERGEKFYDKIEYKIQDFYNKFDKDKKNGKRVNYFRTLSKKKKEQHVPFLLYKKIIREYLEIYFLELFYIDKIHYFFLGGEAVRCRTSKFVTFDEQLIPDAITFLWYKRPLWFYANRVNHHFIRGSTNWINKIRKDFAATESVELLPVLPLLRKEYFEKNILTEQKDE